MNKFNHLLTLSIFAALASPSCALLGSGKTKTEDGDMDMKLGSYAGLKHAIGVVDFENEAGWSGRWKLGSNMSIMLESALFDSGRFVVVEREKLGYVLAEQDLAASGRMAGGGKKVAQTGKLRSARYLASGAITEVDGSESGGDAGVRIKRFNVGFSKADARVTIIAKLIDTSSGEIVAKKRIVGKPSKRKLKFGYAGADLGVDLGGFKKTPLGQAAQDAIGQAAKFFATSMEEYPFEGRVVKVTNNGQVIINRGSQYGVEVDQEMVVRTEGELLIDPDTGEVLDEEEGEVVGKLRVAKVKEKVAYCDLLEGDTPEKGAVVQVGN